MSESAARSHTVTWNDPAAALAAARGLSGMEYVLAMRSGELPAPPIASTMALRFEDVKPGHIVFRGRAFEYHYNPMGVVHGGFASTLLDSALGFATLTLVPKGSFFTTVDLHVNFVRPIHADLGELRASADVLSPGKKIITSFARLEDENGKLYAHANSTCMVLPWPA